MLSTDIRALTFDVFGTVVDWRSGIAREVEAALAPKGHALDWNTFALHWRDRYQPAMEEVRSGRHGFVILDVLHREMLEETLAEFGVSGLEEAEKAELTRAWHRLDPWPDVVEGLTRLKRRFIVAPLSNGNIALMVNMAKRAGLPWDVILGAETAGAYKPSDAAYDDAPRKLALEPSQCMMVAAHESDLHAASARGFCTAYVFRPDEYGDAQMPERPAQAQFDLSVDSFVDLAEALGC